MRTNPLLTGLQVGAVMLFLLLLLPLVAAAAFVSRFVLLAVALVALVAGTGLYFGSARFRDWLRTFSESELQYKGLRLATDVAVSPAHAWARSDGDGTQVGSDDLGPTLLGPVGQVELPALGRWLQRGEPLAHLRRGNRSVVVRAPVSGVVVGRNEALRWRPELVNDAPYTDGWIARLQSDGARREASALPHGRAGRAWFRAEIDRLLPALLGHEPATAADGGQLVHQVYRQIDDATWQRLLSTFFDGRNEPGAAAAVAAERTSEER